MSVHATMPSCPNCGAPLSTKVSARTALCVFCNTSLVLSAPASGDAAPVCTAQPVAAADLERVKQLLIDGKRGDAVELYRTLAAVTPLEAGAALDNVVMESYAELTRHLPLRARSFLVQGVIVIGASALSAWAAFGNYDPSFRLPLLASSLAAAAVAVWLLLGLPGHLRATLLHAFGATGRGRVVRQGMLRAMPENDAYLIAVVFEVSPDDGSAVFGAQVTVFVSGTGLAKLVPNNVLRVRFDGARQRVLVQSPGTVL